MQRMAGVIRIINSNSTQCDQQHDAMVLELKKALLGRRAALSRDTAAAIDVINDDDGSNSEVAHGSEDVTCLAPSQDLPSESLAHQSQPPVDSSSGKKKNKAKEKWLTLWILFL